jgi:hypothetical protein
MRHNFTCIELKTGTVTEEDLNQIIMYENWLIRKLAGGDNEMVQSILVGFNFDERVISYRAKRNSKDEEGNEGRLTSGVIGTPDLFESIIL